MSSITDKKSHDLLPAPLGSVKLGASKKVTVTSSAQLIVTANEVAIGVAIRVISLDSAVKFGSSDLTIDSGTNPGAYIITAANQGLVLNATDSIYALCDSGSASLAITALLLPGDTI